MNKNGNEWRGQEEMKVKERKKEKKESQKAAKNEINRESKI
jgi:hypothetical protein